MATSSPDLPPPLPADARSRRRVRLGLAASALWALLAGSCAAYLFWSGCRMPWGSGHPFPGWFFFVLGSGFALAGAVPLVIAVRTWRRSVEPPSDS